MNSSFRNDIVMNENADLDTSHHLNNIQCIHSRKLLSLIDLNNENGKSNHLQNHVVNCLYCQGHYLNLQAMIKNISVNIPVYYPDDAIKNDFRREVSDLLQEYTTRYLKGNGPVFDRIVNHIKKLVYKLFKK